MKKLTLILALICTFSARAQDWVDAAAALSGCSSAEEMEQNALDHFEYLHLHRVRINGGRLASLLTPYQIATVQDYRRRCGDILSPAELALVDGFSTEKVRILEPFLSFESSRRPGEAVKDTMRLGVKAIARAELKCIAGKTLVDGGDAVQAGYARRYYFDGRSGGSFFASCSYPGGRFLAGNYNLRYGEGLLFWSGLSMDQMSTVDGFSRRGGGLSPSWSLSGEGTYRGFAGEYAHGLWNSMAFISETGYGGRISALSRTGSYGLNLLASQGSLASSVDIKQRLRGADLFGEFAIGGQFVSAPRQGASVTPHPTIAAIAGTRIPLSESLTGAMSLAALPSAWTGRKYGEYSAAAGLKYSGGGYVPIAGKTGFGSSEKRHCVDAVAQLRLLPIPQKDPRRREFKLTASWGFRPDSLLRLDTRAIVRLRSYEPARAELRSDIGLSDGVLAAKLRLHGAWCEGPGFLSYGELGYAPGAFKIWLRGTVYSTSSWASRIYVYERDIPGGFSVPACYGSGRSISLLLTHTLRRRHFRLKSALCASAAQKKSGTSAGLKIQFIAQF